MILVCFSCCVQMNVCITRKLCNFRARLETLESLGWLALFFCVVFPPRFQIHTILSFAQQTVHFAHHNQTLAWLRRANETKWNKKSETKKMGVNKICLCKPSKVQQQGGEKIARNYCPEKSRSSFFMILFIIYYFMICSFVVFGNDPFSCWIVIPRNMW